MTELESPKKSHAIGAKVFIVLVVIFVAAIASGGYYYYTQYIKTISNDAATKEIAAVVEKVGVLTDLPADQVPVLATVTEKEKLAPQPFFSRAENGDKVLFYTTLGRAILYRPSTNKIIEMTVISATDTASTTQPTATTPPSAKPNTSSTPTPDQAEENTVKFKLLNGTEIPGLTSKLESTLSSFTDTFTVIEKANAALKTYEKTRVIDVSRKFSPIAKKIADKYSVSVEQTLPTDETAKGADIVVILGTDAK